MAIATNLGYPRIGIKRELKQALEAYWQGKITSDELEEQGRQIRMNNWQLQNKLGLQHIPSNDFSFYDQVLDTSVMVGAIPTRYQWDGKEIDFNTYFAMARGAQRSGIDVPAMEMTKWFDTNYHYIVPEFEEGQKFKFSSMKPVREFQEALEAGIKTRPVIVGPVTYLLSGKMQSVEKDVLSLLPDLLPVYCELLEKLQAVGAEWIQIDEPFLVLDLSENQVQAYLDAYKYLGSSRQRPFILLSTYFDSVGDHHELLSSLPIEALHVDLVRAPDQLDEIIDLFGKEKFLSLGLVDGRNIWRTDFDQALSIYKKVEKKIGVDRIWIAPSCSLLHVPLDVNQETAIDPQILSWMAFAQQKIEELVALTEIINQAGDKNDAILADNRAVIQSRVHSDKVHNNTVNRRLKQITPQMLKRNNPFAIRSVLQQDSFKLPLFPTTTIGSFPQTPEVRRARAQVKRGSISQENYEGFIKTEIEQTIRFQEEIGIDVLVHGEFERNDMVQYFGEQLSGFAFTENGWVQSFGSRNVRPPIIYGDVERPQQMTVKWARFAQSLTQKPVKGMLTGPITILQWSFVRDDQPRSVTCRQIALAIRDEVRDLETGGIRIIQIDEPALREGLPLRRSQWKDYLDWAVECFHLSSSGVRDDTQIHTHMCYSEFNDIIDSIAALDADVISIEASRSKMDLLNAFVRFHYPNAVGPGVYDIHSPRIPSQEEMTDLLEKALKVIPQEQLWINPDCGLKTRGWEETRASLDNMVHSARELRKKVQKG